MKTHQVFQFLKGTIWRKHVLSFCWGNILGKTRCFGVSPFVGWEGSLPKETPVARCNPKGDEPCCSPGGWHGDLEESCGQRDGEIQLEMQFKKSKDLDDLAFCEGFSERSICHGQSFFEGLDLLRCGATVEHCQKLRDLTVKPFSKSSLPNPIKKRYSISPKNSVSPWFAGYDLRKKIHQITQTKQIPNLIQISPGSCAGCVDFRPAAKAPEPCSKKWFAVNVAWVNWVMGCVYLYMFFSPDSYSMCGVRWRFVCGNACSTFF